MVTSKGRGKIQGAGPGRPKGSKDKFTRDIKEALLEAFNSPELGGVGGMVEWAKNPRNRGKFYDHLCKLIPQKVEADINGTLELTPTERAARIAAIIDTARARGTGKAPDDGQ